MPPDNGPEGRGPLSGHNSISQAGYGGIGATIHNWSPGPGPVIEVQGGDNEGTRVTGLDATGLDPTKSHIRIIANNESRSDAGVIVLRHENTGSLADNRFHLPEYRDFYIGPQEFTFAIRLPLLDGAGNPTGNSARWCVGGHARSSRLDTQNLHIYPPLEVGIAVPISGTLHNWNPVGEPPDGSYNWGLAGSNLAFLDHTFVKVGVNAAGATVTGMYWGDVAQDTQDAGAIKIIFNAGPGPLTFKHMNGGSTAIYQMALPCDDDLTLPEGETAIFFHQHGGTWQVIGGSAPSRIAARRVTVTGGDPTVAQIGVTGNAGQNDSINVANGNTAQTIAGTSVRGVIVQLAGSYATATGISVIGVGGQTTSSKSSGVGSVTNYGLYGDAANGDVNYSGFFDRGKFRVQGPMEFVGASLLATPMAEFDAGIRLMAANGPTITSGSGSPEGVVTAPVGSLYTNTAGGTSTTLYVKTSGAGNTGWTAK